MLLSSAAQAAPSSRAGLPRAAEVQASAPGSLLSWTENKSILWEEHDAVIPKDYER